MVNLIHARYLHSTFLAPLQYCCMALACTFIYLTVRDEKGALTGELFSGDQQQCCVNSLSVPDLCPAHSEHASASRSHLSTDEIANCAADLLQMTCETNGMSLCAATAEQSPLRTYKNTIQLQQSQHYCCVAGGGNSSLLMTKHPYCPWCVLCTCHAVDFHCDLDPDGPGLV